MFSCFALLASFVPTGDWTALESPALCAQPAPPSEPEALLDGIHVLLRPRGNDAERSAPPAKLPLSLATQMLEELARARGSKLEFLRAAPTLLVRGDDELVQSARALLADLGAQGERLDIELTCELTGGTQPANALRSRARVRSGDEAFFGARRTRSFVSGFDVEVAADSGVAQPTRGIALHGPSLHVRVTRVDGGRRVHVQGLLDLAELGDVVRFDPDTVDLGVIEEPLVSSVQVAFAGVVESGGTLQVTLQGAALPTPDWTLTLGATTKPDAEASADAAGWTMLDVAFLASEPRALAAIDPGGQLAREGNFGLAPSAPQALPAAAIAAAIDQERTSGGAGRNTRVPLYWTNDLLFVPRSEATLLRSAKALVRAAETARLVTGRIELKRGNFSVSLPSCEGHLARVCALQERPYLTDYHSELAPQTWMPSPQMELVRDGWRAELAPYGGALTCEAWSARSETPLEVTRQDAQLGKLQVLRRTLWTESARVTRKESARSLFSAEPSGPGTLTIAFDTP